MDQKKESILYDDPVYLEPLLPRDVVLNPALELAHDLQAEAARLVGMVQGGAARELSGLLRAMNSYYTNKIEGEHTRPLELAQAMRADFSVDGHKARLQRLALAHMATEAWLSAQPWHPRDLYQPAAVQGLHAHLFGQLSLADRTSVDEKTGVSVVTEPGVWRQVDVQVARHAAPSHAAVPAMVQRWSAAYGGVRRGELEIVAALAAHHRLLWIHPFADGNGRAARLHTHAVLNALGLTGGLWSPLRGFARSERAYIEYLGNADMPRAGDLDGRGQRSERHLLAWVTYALQVCLDQVRFMGSMLHLKGMKDRLAALLMHEQQVLKNGVRIEALLPLHYLFAVQGELDRGSFASMTGLHPRLGSNLITALLERGLLRSDTPRGPLRLGVPLHALRLLFPNLWPEAEADASSVA